MHNDEKEFKPVSQWHKIFVVCTTLFILDLNLFMLIQLLSVPDFLHNILQIISIGVLVIAAILEVPCRSHLGITDYASGVVVLRQLPPKIKIFCGAMIGIAIILFGLSII